MGHTFEACEFPDNENGEKGESGGKLPYAASLRASSGMRVPQSIDEFVVVLNILHGLKIQTPSGPEEIGDGEKVGAYVMNAPVLNFEDLLLHSRVIYGYVTKEFVTVR